MGAVTTMLISFILPTVFYLYTHWAEVTRLKVGLCSCIIATGVGGMAIGMASLTSSLVAALA